MYNETHLCRALNHDHPFNREGEAREMRSAGNERRSSGHAPSRHIPMETVCCVECVLIQCVRVRQIDPAYF